MEITQRKVSNKDIDGTKKFSLKAQEIYPCIEWMIRMMVMLENLLVMEHKINGEMDWLNFGIWSKQWKVLDEEYVEEHVEMEKRLDHGEREC